MTCSNNGYRHRENKGANAAGWVLGIILIIVLIIACVQQYNGNNKRSSQMG